MFVNLYSRLDRMYTLLHNCFFLTWGTCLENCKHPEIATRRMDVSHTLEPKKNNPFENPIVSPCFNGGAPSPMTQNCIPLRRHLPKQLREHPAWPTRRRWPVRWTIACHSPLWKGKNVIVLPCHFPTIVFQVFFKATLLCFHFLYPLVN